ncbi:MAG: PAS domain S-box protein [Betaproteobacteria bacterium]|nr:PAS domain S-box protein [Betaproteobacteria bacterium]
MPNRARKILSGWTIRSGLVGLVGIVALLVLGLANEYQEADKHAQVEVKNLSRLLEEHALATVQKADLLLRDIQGDVRPGDMRLAREANTPRARELHASLKFHRETVPDISVLHLTNAKGEHIHSSISPLPHIDIADRPYFQRQRNDAAAGLVISPPLISRTTGKWTLILTRRLNFEDGGFAGVALAVLDMDRFQKLFRSLDLGAHGLVALYDTELHMAARFPTSEKDIGKKIPGLYVEGLLKKGLKHGVYHTRSPVDGVKRLFSFRQVGDLPLVVIAGIAEDDYLAEWRQHVWQYGIGLVILCLMVASLELRQRRAEEALRKSDEDLHTIADYTYDWEYWEGAQRELRYMSPSCERITGYSLAEFKADPELLYRIVHPDDRHLMEAHHNNIAHQDIANIDFRIMRRDGEICWISHGCQAVYGKDGEHLGRRANNRDITERKAIEQALQESEERFRLISMAANDGIIILGSEDRVVYWSPAAEKIFGYPASEILDRKMHELVAPARYREDFHRGFEHFMASGKGPLIGKTLEIEALHKDGAEIPVELSISAFQIKGQWHALGIVRDISERKKAELEFKTIIQTTMDGFLVIDAHQGQFLDTNDAYCKMLGYGRDELLNLKTTDIEVMETPEDVIAHQTEIRNTGHAHFETRHRRKDGKTIDVDVSTTYLDVRGGVLIAFIRDITERKRLEKELLHLNQTLEQQVKNGVARNMEQERLLIQQSRLAAMGEMIGNIAHQWRQPINALTLLLGNIKDAYEYNELDKKYLDSEVDKGQQMILSMSATIDDFRNFFKPNKEKQNFQPCDGIEDAIKLVSHSFKNCNIEIEFEKNDERCKVMGYPNEFAQVVLNALSNAKEAIVEKKIHGKVHIRVEKETDKAIVSIRDNAGGIPEEILPKVFDPYFTTKEKGTGIGLYMSKTIMDHMDGDIVIRNIAGGTEVLITLPLVVPAV